MVRPDSSFARSSGSRTVSPAAMRVLTGSVIVSPK
jgi:hypothetical protein